MKRAILGLLAINLSLGSGLTYATLDNIKEASFYSESLGAQKKYNIYLPPGYEKTDKRYPVLYLFHGHHGEEYPIEYTHWASSTSLPNYADKYEMIIVMPQGDNGFYVNSFDESTKPPYQGKYEDYIIKDLIGHIDTTYRTIPDRQHRAFGGISMGGHGAVSLALKHPDMVCATTSMSGAIGVGVLKVFPNIFGPWPGLKPYYLGNSSPALIFNSVDRVTNKEACLRFFIECGLEDIHQDIQEAAAEFVQLLQEFGIPSRYRTYPGGHNWVHWASYVDEVLEFAWETFKNPPAMPAVWNYRSIYPEFTIWGNKFQIDREEEWAFLNIHNFSPGGFELSGEGASGELKIETTGFYQPETQYKIVDYNLEENTSSKQTVTSDKRGALHFSLDLGNFPDSHSVTIETSTGPTITNIHYSPREVHLGEKVSISAQIPDSNLKRAFIRYQKNNLPQFAEPMEKKENIYSVNLGTFSANDVISFRIEAQTTDGRFNNISGGQFHVKQK